MVMETPSAQCVGREFVRQYYTLLHEAPMHLHRFYSHNSCFVHGGVDKPGEMQAPVMGQADIHKKICSLNFRDCHAKIRQVDSQATVGSAVVVQVTGELSNNGQPMRRFMQTFVLVPQSPKKYYVHNDIFRYQDEVFHDNDTDNENLEEVGGSYATESPVESDSEHELSEPVPVEEPPAAIVPNLYEPQPASQPISNGTTHEDLVETPTPKAVEEPPKMEVEEEKPEEPEIFVDEKPIVEKSPEPEPEPEQQGPMTGMMTWAAMLSKPSAPSGPAPVTIKPQHPAPVVKTQQPEAMKIETTTPTPQPQRAARQQRERVPLRERDGSRGGPDSEDARRPRHPDSHQIFVGNLPHNITEREVQEYFEGYGKVVDMRINKKGGSTAVPNYGFVVFETDKAVQAVLSHKGHFLLADGHRLNVEEKKMRGEASGRPGSGTRAGGRGGNSGRGGPGGPGRGGNRGGMGGPPRDRPDNRPPRGEGGPRGGFGAPRR